MFTVLAPLVALSLASAPDPNAIDPKTGLPNMARPESTAPTTPTPAPTTSPTPSQPAPTARPQTPAPTPTSPPTTLDRRPMMPPRGDGPLPPTDSAQELPRLEVDATAPFATEPVALSEALKLAFEANVDLANNAIDIAISETQVMAAIGAYDVFVLAGLNASQIRAPQRGSAFAFNTGSKAWGGNAGLRRKLETGGTLTFNVSASRSITTQPISIFNAAAGTYNLNGYNVTSTLQLTHPLLKGAGLRVNRADIDRAKIAVNQQEAVRMVVAQNVVRDVILAYWEVLYAQRDLQNKRRSAQIAGEQLKRTQAEIAAGRRSPLDGRSLEQTLALREADILLAENVLLERSLNLRNLLGQDIADREVLGIEAASDPQLLQPRPVDIKDEIRRAIEANPQVRQLQLALASKRIDELVAANQRLPQLDLSASFIPRGVSNDKAPTAQTGDPGTRGSWREAFGNYFNDDIADKGLLADYQLVGSLSLTWDVQNRTPKANHERTLLELKKAENSLKVNQRQISTSVVRAANQMRSAGKRMEVTQFSVDLAKENLEAERARYSVGRSTSYEVLFRMDELALAESNALRAQIDYLLALTELQTLTGELLPAYGIELLKNPGAGASASKESRAGASGSVGGSASAPRDR